jgi:predicted amidohydrolase
MQVAAIQMVSTGVVQDNLAHAAKLLEQAAKAGAHCRALAPLR